MPQSILTARLMGSALRFQKMACEGIKIARVVGDRETEA